MTILDKDRLHYIEKVLLYTPIMVGIFIALSVWSGGLTVGFTVIGVILIGITLDSINKKIAGNNKRFVPPVYSSLIVIIGGYLLVTGNIYNGIFYVLVGMNLIFEKFLKEKWKSICCAIALTLAVGALILYFLEVS